MFTWDCVRKLFKGKGKLFKFEENNDTGLCLLKKHPTQGTVTARVIHITNDPQMYSNNCYLDQLPVSDHAHFWSSYPCWVAMKTGGQGAHIDQDFLFPEIPYLLLKENYHSWKIVLCVFKYFISHLWTPQTPDILLSSCLYTI